MENEILGAIARWLERVGAPHAGREIACRPAPGVSSNTRLNSPWGEPKNVVLLPQCPVRMACSDR